ncbi:Tic22 family protein [Chamaesiphon sp. VAR_48_metabat_403]|uniref:Tic22 family protein n=1 Tax=Chamaesiphon sp. VAR_48_metabat_403 TaxID=2964700 RepID=UPI00286E1886|nr:Tic22 family protein [Chamaesiphon sp. VAR_48_metabat_403]
MTVDSYYRSMEGRNLWSRCSFFNIQFSRTLAYYLMFKSLMLSIAISIAMVPLVTIAPLPAQALPEAQIVDKLQKVPVFAITNNTGNFLQQNVTAAGKTRVITPIFMELKDAVSFLTKLKKDQPKQSKVAQVTVVPLSEIYKLQVEAQKKSQNVSFVFFPTEQQLKNAQLLKKPYQANALYPVPLFMVAIEQQGKYVTVQENNLTPLFFSKQQAQQWLDRVKKKDAKLVAKAEIKVNYLHVVVADFQGKNYAEQKQLVLVPSAESVDSVRKIQAAQPKPSSTSTTTPKK